MSNQPAPQPKQEQPPIGFYLLMGIVGLGLVMIDIYLAMSYFAK